MLQPFPTRLPPVGSSFNDSWCDGDFFNEELSISPSGTFLSGISSGLSDRPLRSISMFGRRANQRALEASIEIAVRDTRDSSKLAEVNNNAFTGTFETEKKNFEMMLSSIDVVLTGGRASSPLQVVRRDDSVIENLHMNASRHYRVPLPNRPTAVAAILQRSSGTRPCMWGSTSCERPSARNHDYRGKDDKLVYEHVLGGDDDEDNLRDKHHSAPKCSDLYITVEANTGEAGYKMTIFFEPIKVALRQVRMQKRRRGWESRAADLQRDTDAREQFEEHVQHLKEQRRLLRQLASNGVDYLQRNIEQITDAKSSERLAQAKLVCERQVSKQANAMKTREELEDTVLKKRIAWIGRGEARKRQRELEEQEDIERELRGDRQRKWLVGLSLVAFTAKTGVHFKELREAHELMQRQLCAQAVLRSFFVRFNVRQRRLNQYRNIIKFRMGLATYARVMFPAVLTTCQTAVKTFIDCYAFNRETPSLRSTLQQFRARVVLIQRVYRRKKMCRSMYVQLFFPMWLDIQDRIYNQMVANEVSRIAQQDAKAMEILVQQMNQGIVSPKTKKTMRRLQNNVKISVPAKINAQMPPDQVVKKWLYEYIRDMMKSRDKRIKRWEERAQFEAFNKDLERFGVLDSESNSRVAAGKPGLVYKDEAELEELVTNRINGWICGAYKDVRANRLRLLHTPFEKWDMLARKSKLGITDNRELPRRSTLGRKSVKKAPSTAIIEEDEFEDDENDDDGEEFDVEARDEIWCAPGMPMNENWAVSPKEANHEDSDEDHEPVNERCSVNEGSPMNEGSPVEVE